VYGCGQVGHICTTVYGGLCCYSIADSGSALIVFVNLVVQGSQRGKRHNTACVRVQVVARNSLMHCMTGTPSLPQCVLQCWQVSDWTLAVSELPQSRCGCPAAKLQASCLVMIVVACLVIKVTVL
jgi:hypothetical protein